MLYAILIGLLVGLLLGGRAVGLAQIQFRWAPVAIIGLLAQVALFSPALTGVVGQLGPPLYIGTTLMVVAVVVRNVRTSPALALVALGAVSNLAAILSNGGFMPATPEAVAATGRAASVGYSNSVELNRPALELLIDRFAMPAGIPLANVFSVGDVLIGLGVAGVIVVAMRSGRPSRPVESDR
jgi:hypothetical protein